MQEDAPVQPVALELVPLSPYLRPAPLPDLPQVLQPPHVFDACNVHAYLTMYQSSIYLLLHCRFSTVMSDVTECSAMLPCK